MTKLETHELMKAHEANLKAQVPNPSKETLSAWEIDKIKNQMLTDHYIKEEAEDPDDNIDVNI